MIHSHIPTISISPNPSGLPGLPLLESIVGGLLAFALVVCVAGVAVGAGAWAMGSHSGNPHVASRGKNGVLVAVGAAVLVGAASILVTWASAAGGRV